MSPRMSPLVVHHKEDANQREELKVLKENFQELESALYILSTQSYEKLVF
jgi:hypothetical protein